MATTARIGNRKTWTVNVGAYNGGTHDHSKLFNRDADNQHPMGAIKGLETFAENTKDHMASKENPHEVTADQVGARPDTWMPTATEVGARPDTWMPTAAEVGAAPAKLVDGFYTVADGTDEAFLEVINTVYASMPDISVRYIVVAFSKAHPIVGGSTYIIKISRVYADYGTLEMSSYSGLAFCRTRTNNAWQAFECDNPNMTVGVEYRTTERWNGKAVYTALVSMGNLPNATTKSVSVPGDKVATNIVRFNAIATLSGKFAYDMMCLSGVTRVEFRYGTDSNVYMNVATNTDMSAYSGTFQLWYTKD